jgi:hypothetical protein
MEYGLRFSNRYTYDSRREGITVPAVLKAGAKTVALLAKIDTGAEDCLFEHSFAEALGLRVEDGLRKGYSTVNSRFDVYGHEISILVLDIEVVAMVYFYADPGIQRNVLGRRGWLDRVRLGLVDPEQIVYIADYNS